MIVSIFKLDPFACNTLIVVFLHGSISVWKPLGLLELFATRLYLITFCREKEKDYPFILALAMTVCIPAKCTRDGYCMFRINLHSVLC